MRTHSFSNEIKYEMKQNKYTYIVACYEPFIFLPLQMKILLIAIKCVILFNKIFTNSGLDRNQTILLDNIYTFIIR